MKIEKNKILINYIIIQNPFKIMMLIILISRNSERKKRENKTMKSKNYEMICSDASKFEKQWNEICPYLFFISDILYNNDLQIVSIVSSLFDFFSLVKF